MKGYAICPSCIRSCYIDESILITGIVACPFCNAIYSPQMLKEFVKDTWATGPPPATGQFQRYPGRFWYNFLRTYSLDQTEDKVLHMFSGSMDWGDTTDLRAETGATFVGPYDDLPIEDNVYDFVIADPPYTMGFANEWITHKKDLPKPKRILLEAARVTKPNGIIAIMHVILIPAYKVANVKRTAIHNILVGPNNAFRGLNVYRKLGDEE